MLMRCAANCWRARFWWTIDRRRVCAFRRTFTIARKSVTSRWSRSKKSCPRALGRNMRLPRLRFKFMDDGSEVRGAKPGAAGSLSPANFADARRAMVEEQIRRRHINDENVLAAMAQVPRHEFVPPEFRVRAYEDA